MKKMVIIPTLFFFTTFFLFAHKQSSSDQLRRIYSGPSTQWPKPEIDPGILWKELDVLPASPFLKYSDSLQKRIELGKILFFEPRLSGSGKISCASCHQPELSWTDGKEKSVGHEGSLTKRNSPSIQNSWFYNKLFWDGRAKSLEDQAFAPINSETEMNNEMHLVMIFMNKSSAYKKLFKEAFGDEHIDPDRLTEAIASFEKTIVSRKSRFDNFLEGNKNALTDNELRGLHLFRSKARCMNCHNGPLFSDNGFHNNGFSDSDKGLYMVTHHEEDMGKMKTPSLRDVMKTGPWMHNGIHHNMEEIIEKYNRGIIPAGTDKLVRPLNLSKKEKKNIIAFLNAISSPPGDFKRPVVPE